MIFYYTFLFFLLILSLNYKKDTNVKKKWISRIAIILILGIGFRHEVGGDWESYLEMMVLDKNFSLSSLFRSEYLYHLLNAWFYDTDIGIYGVNLICAIFFVLPLFFIIKKFSVNPYLTLLFAFPILIVILAMGYTRQSVSVSFFALALYYWIENKKIKYLLCFIIALYFHTSAILLLAIPLLVKDIFKIRWVIASSALFFILFLFFKNRFHLYLDSDSNMQSAGVLFRLLNYISLLILFLFFNAQKKIILSDDSPYKYFYKNSIKFLFVLFLPISFIFSTAIDRIAIYFALFYFILAANAIEINNKTKTRNILLGFLVTLTLFSIWVNYSEHAKSFSYKNLFFNTTNDNI